MKDAPQNVSCLFCGVGVPVPSRAMAAEQAKEKGGRKPDEIGDYAISSESKLPVKSPAKPLKSKGSKPVAPSEIVLTCSLCHELVPATVGSTAGQVRCPECGTMIVVPDRHTAAKWTAAKVAPKDAKIVGDYGVGPAPELPAPRRFTVFDKLAEVRREAPPPPPRWTFFSGVFTFPFHKDVILRWGFLSAGFTAIALVAMIGLSIGTGAGSYTGMAAAFFALPLVWLAIWTFSYAAACFLRVLESTAAGMPEVEAWPDPVWKEWMAQLIYLGWITALPVVVSYGVAKLTEVLGGPFWPVLGGSLFLIFPIVLLSALEANSVWIPLTLPIVRSLFVLWWGWILFYAETGALAGVVLALIVFGRGSLGAPAIIAAGPYLAAFVLIYARLLGRLAWRAFGHQP